MSLLSELKKRVSYQSLLLAGFALLASSLLGLADFNTRDVIKVRLEEDLLASLEQVIPSHQYNNNLLKDTINISSKEEQLGHDKTLVYLARLNGQVNAVSYNVATGGYSGTINLLIGVDKTGHLLGVRVISHTETPGLGDKIEVTKSTWILSFNGHSLQNLSIEEWAVKKDGGTFDQFSGATITPRAVVNAVYRGLQFFKKHQAELLDS